MFLKREIGMLFYFPIIFFVRFFYEVFQDGIELLDYIGIFNYSIISFLIINILLIVIELLVSLARNNDIRFWKYFNATNCFIVLLILWLIVFLLGVLVFDIDKEAQIIWGSIIFVGEVVRAIYSYKINVK
jgi:hypothetical protein